MTVMLESRIERTILKYNMLRGAGEVFVGLSGGADSVSLLLALLELRKSYGFTLGAVHVNHHIRGAEADRDRSFCADLCEKIGVPLRIFHVDAPAYAEKMHLSTEEAARILRYEKFEELPKTALLATAHNLNDNAETILFNLSRGTGLKGLCGIPPVRGRFIRPLIECTRGQIEDYLSIRGQAFVTDSTNLEDDCSRNITRHKILPLMEEIHGGFLENIRRTSEFLSEDSDYLEKCATEAAESDLRTLHPSIRKRVIKQFLEKNDIPVSAESISRLEALIFAENGTLNVKRDVYVCAKEGRLFIKPPRFTPVVCEAVKAHIGENRFLSDKIVSISVQSGENIAGSLIVNKNLTKWSLDCDKIQGDVILRNRREGDALVLCGRNFTSSLKKLLNARYKREERDFIPVLADELGIIWVQDFGISDRVKITCNTVNSWNISVYKNAEK